MLDLVCSPYELTIVYYCLSLWKSDSVDRLYLSCFSWNNKVTVSFQTLKKHCNRKHHVLNWEDNCFPLARSPWHNKCQTVMSLPCTNIITLLYQYCIRFWLECGCYDLIMKVLVVWWHMHQWSARYKTAWQYYLCSIPKGGLRGL